MTRPALATPFYDPDGRMFPHLAKITPDLKAVFSHACLGISAGTLEAHPENIRRLQSDDFFHLHLEAPGLEIGEQFASLFRFAAASCPPGQALQLCFLDRAAFALEGEYREEWMACAASVRPEELPLVFLRSPAAWDTHPRNYRQLEQMASRVGELLLGKYLDFGWCQLIISAGRLAEIMMPIHRKDLSMMAEMMLALKDEIHSREVDWLAWEDPFLLGEDAAALKAEREHSTQETRKRLAYVIPTLELLYRSVER